MNYILIDPPCVERYYPFTLTRPFGEMRVFGGTIKEIWEKYLGCEVSYLTQHHLEKLYPMKWSENNDNFFIPSWFLPFPDSPFKQEESKTCVSSIFMSETDCQKILNIDSLTTETFRNHLVSNIDCLVKEMSISITRIYSYQKLTFPVEGHLDFSEYGSYFSTHFFPTKSNIDCSNNPFLNDDNGPIIIEEDVTIMEGAMIRGPVHICKGSTIKMGAKVYGPTIIGPYCKIGGEVSNCIFLGYSNKAHEGFLGHSIIGEWCNIGAGTSNSNLKNDYGTVKMWDYQDKKFKDSGNQFLGLYMGDHSKCAINTSFNTGTTVGVNCNVFGAGFPRNFIPSFSWGGAQGVKAYDFEKAISVAEIVMDRRGVKLTPDYIDMLRSVHDITSNMK